MVKIAIFGLTHRFKHRITRKLLKIDRKLLKIDGYMLRDDLQAPNSLSIHTTFSMIVLGTYALT